MAIVTFPRGRTKRPIGKISRSNANQTTHEPVQEKAAIVRGALEVFQIMRGLDLPQEDPRPFWDRDPLFEALSEIARQR